MKVRIKKLPQAQSGLEVKLDPGKTFNYRAMPWPNKDMSISEEELRMNTTLKPVPRSEANVEAEKGEIVVSPGQGGIPNTFKVGGNRHSKGGTPLNLPGGSFVFSDTARMKIKDPKILSQFGMVPRKGGYTPAEIAKKYDNTKYLKLLKDPRADDLQRRTAEQMIINNNMMLAKLAFIQESIKGFPEGIPEVAMPYLQKMGIDPSQLMAQQDQQSMPEDQAIPEDMGQQIPPEMMQEEEMMQFGGTAIMEQLMMRKYGGLPMAQSGIDFSYKAADNYKKYDDREPWSDPGFNMNTLVDVLEWPQRSMTQLLGTVSNFIADPLNPTVAPYARPGDYFASGFSEGIPDWLGGDYTRQGMNILVDPTLAVPGSAYVKAAKYVPKALPYIPKALSYIPKAGTAINKAVVQPTVEFAKTYVPKIYPEVIKPTVQVAKQVGPRAVPSTVRTISNSMNKGDVYTFTQEEFEALPEETKLQFYDASKAGLIQVNITANKKEFGGYIPEYAYGGEYLPMAQGGKRIGKYDNSESLKKMEELMKKKKTNNQSTPKKEIVINSDEEYRKLLLQPASPEKDKAITNWYAKQKAEQNKKYNEGFKNYDEYKASLTTPYSKEKEQAQLKYIQSDEYAIGKEQERIAEEERLLKAAEANANAQNDQASQAGYNYAPTWDDYAPTSVNQDVLGKYAKHMERIDKVLADEEFTNEMYNKFREQIKKAPAGLRAKLNMMKKPEVIKVLRQLQKQNYAMKNAGFDPTTDKLDLWDKTQNTEYKKMMQKLGFDKNEVLKEGDIAAAQAAFNASIDVGSQDKYTKKYGRVYTLAGLQDEGYDSRSKGITAPDDWYGNTTAGYLMYSDEPEAETKTETKTETQADKVDIKDKGFTPRYKNPNYAPWWIQDLTNIANASRKYLGVKKYSPWESIAQPVIPEVNLTGYERQAAGIGEMANIGANQMAAYLPDQAFLSNYSALQGNAGRDIANVIGQNQGVNIGLMNARNQQEAEILNRFNQIYTERANRLHKGETTAQYLTDAERSAAMDELVKQTNAGFKNRANAQAMNELYEDYYVDPSSGGMVFENPWHRQLTAEKANETVADKIAKYKNAGLSKDELELALKYDTPTTTGTDDYYKQLAKQNYLKSISGMDINPYASNPYV